MFGTNHNGFSELHKVKDTTYPLLQVISHYQAMAFLWICSCRWGQFSMDNLQCMVGIITNVESPETKGIEWNKSPFVMTSEVVLIHSDLDIRHMYICDYLCIYYFTCVYIYTYIYILYIHIHILYHIGKKTIWNQWQNTVKQKKHSPNYAAETPELQNSLWKVAFFSPKNFRHVVKQTRSSTSSLSLQGMDHISHQTGSLENHRLKYAHFWGDMWYVSFLEGKPPKKKCFNSMILENRKAQCFPSFRCQPFVLLRFHQNGRQITQLQRRDEKKGDDKQSWQRSDRGHRECQ